MRFITITLIVHAPDPVTGEQKSTQDHLSGGRLELIIGKGNGAAQRDLFHVTPQDQWDRNAESYATRNSQDAIDAYRPVFAGYLAFQERLGVQPVFPTLEDFIERSSALIGSPAQVIEKVHRYHEQFGHSVLHLHADAGGLTDAQHRASLELFQSDIAPVLRREIPDPPWGWGGGPIGDDAIKTGTVKTGTVPAPAIAAAG